MINLLFVDDEQSVLDGLRRSLRPRRHEWNVSFASSGTQALQLLSHKEFHGIVTDMRMPGMDGLTLLKHVSETHPNTLRIVLSGQSEMEKLAKSEGLTHHYLSKPCPVEVLGPLISRAFSLRRSFAEPALVSLVSRLEGDPAQWRPQLQTRTSTYAEKIARGLKGSDGELHRNAKAAGLLLDAGQLALRSCFPHLYLQVEALSLSENIFLSQAETRVFGVSHAALSSYLAWQQGLPDDAVEAIAYHHFPSQCPNPHEALLLAVHIADLLASETGRSEPPLDTAYLDSLGQSKDLDDWLNLVMNN